MTEIAFALAAIQEHLLARNPDLSIQLVGQIHHIRPSGVAFVDVYNCQDKDRRRAVRAEALDMIKMLGFEVDLLPNHDVFLVEPDFSDQARLQTWRALLDKT